MLTRLVFWVWWRFRYMGIGLSAQGVNMNRLPGWDKHSYGYHGDDGHSFCSSGSGQPYGPTFTTNDVIGCGVNLIENTCFYTKVRLGVLRWRACCCLLTVGDYAERDESGPSVRRPAGQSVPDGGPADARRDRRHQLWPVAVRLRRRGRHARPARQSGGYHPQLPHSRQAGTLGGVAPEVPYHLFPCSSVPVRAHRPLIESIAGS